MKILTIPQTIAWLEKQNPPRGKRFPYHNIEEPGCLFTQICRKVWDYKRGEVNVAGYFNTRIRIGHVPFHNDFWTQAGNRAVGITKTRALQVLRWLKAKRH